MLLKILLILWLVAVLGWIVTIIIPVTRENSTQGFMAVLVCALNVIIQVVNICTN